MPKPISTHMAMGMTSNSTDPYPVRSTPMTDDEIKSEFGDLIDRAMTAFAIDVSYACQMIETFNRRQRRATIRDRQARSDGSA